MPEIPKSRFAALSPVEGATGGSENEQKKDLETEVATLRSEVDSLRKQLMDERTSLREELLRLVESKFSSTAATPSSTLGGNFRVIPPRWGPESTASSCGWRSPPPVFQRTSLQDKKQKGPCGGGEGTQAKPGSITENQSHLVAIKTGSTVVSRRSAGLPSATSSSGLFTPGLRHGIRSPPLPAAPRGLSSLVSWTTVVGKRSASVATASVSNVEFRPTTSQTATSSPLGSIYLPPGVLFPASTPAMLQRRSPLTGVRTPVMTRAAGRLGSLSLEKLSPKGVGADSSQGLSAQKISVAPVQVTATPTYPQPESDSTRMLVRNPLVASTLRSPRLSIHLGNNSKSTTKISLNTISSSTSVRNINATSTCSNSIGDKMNKHMKIVPPEQEEKMINNEAEEAEKKMSQKRSSETDAVGDALVGGNDESMPSSSVRDSPPPGVQGDGEACSPRSEQSVETACGHERASVTTLPPNIESEIKPHVSTGGAHSTGEREFAWAIPLMRASIPIKWARS
ncbi:unnamed protein product [Amoebophrya sp. A25]|nr:unnamed protein product [Amoebophrya sp. A25]|eukprot:GSA25T00002612001.1